MKMLRPCVAEFIGTFFFCFAGIAAILSDKFMGVSGGGIVAIALAHGLAISVGVNAFGGLSGAHFNPAVTAGMYVTGRIAAPLAAAYVVTQCLSATVAAVVCKAVFPADVVTIAHLGIPLPANGVSTGVVFVVEFVLTFLLTTAIFGTVIDERGKTLKIGGFGIGLTVVFNILAAGALTGASMNPARSFGPALVTGYFAHQAVYWLATIAGSCAAALVYQHVLIKEEQKSA